jgi:hypothetical protein
MLTLRPWYTEPGAEQLSAASAAESKAITTRALAKSLTRSDFGKAA